VQASIDQAANRQWAQNILTTLISNALVLTGAMLMASQIRLQVSLGQPLNPAYQAEPLLLYPVLIGAALIIAALSGSALALQPPLDRLLSANHPFRRCLVSLGISAVSLLLLFPDLSQLQVVYFAAAGVILAAFCIALPYRIYSRHPGSNIGKTLPILWDRRALLSIWLRFNVESRYSQRILGILWIILLPVATSAVLAVAFTEFLGISIDVPFITFYMAAMVPYSLFSSGLLNSTGAVISRIGIVSQVYFPREILVLLTLGEAIVDFCFAFLALLVINLLAGVLPNAHFVELIPLTVILILMILGLMFLISALTVMVRDIPQLLAVTIQLIFFLTPIIYPVDRFPERLRFIFVLNPLAPVVQGFRDIIAYNRPIDWVSLHYPIVFAGAALVVGYATFKSFESEMADYV
jgi:homopolymeric O-antigen transport system permease protein